MAQPKLLRLECSEQSSWLVFIGGEFHRGSAETAWLRRGCYREVADITQGEE